MISSSTKAIINASTNACNFTCKTTKSILPLLSHQAKRTFYTPVVPKETPRITLQDGSTLIFRSIPSKKDTGISHPLLKDAQDDHSSSSTTPVSNPSTLASLPPPTRTHTRQYSRLSQSQIEEMKELRREDPDAWTVTRLAKHFDTLPIVVMKHTSCSPERLARLEKEAEEEFLNSSVTRQMRLIDRMRRKALW